jgi:hypothetical protein
LTEALRPIDEFKKYKMADGVAKREFYSLLRTTIQSAKTVGHLKLLSNIQTIHSIMGKMPHTDWKQRAN